MRTEAERQAALAALDANGGNIRQTARETGIPASTLRLWQKSAPRDPAAADALLRECRQLAACLVGDMADAQKRRTASLRDLATTFGILMDKVTTLQQTQTDRDDPLCSLLHVLGESRRVAG